MVYAQPRTRPEKWDTQTSGFWDINRSPNLGQKKRPSNSQQKKRTYRIVYFAALADHRVKLKESEKKDKNLDLAREQKKLWNMKVTVIPIVIVALAKVTKGVMQRLEDLDIRRRVEVIQTTEESPGDLRRLTVT